VTRTPTVAAVADDGEPRVGALHGARQPGARRCLCAAPDRCHAGVAVAYRLGAGQALAGSVELPPTDVLTSRS
jgi:hypothetical protein